MDLRYFKDGLSLVLIGVAFEAKLEAICKHFLSGRPLDISPVSFNDEMLGQEHAVRTVTDSDSGGGGGECKCDMKSIGEPQHNKWDSETGNKIVKTQTAVIIDVQP